MNDFERWFVASTAGMDMSRAKRAQRALELLRSEIGPQLWLEKAISACDAIDAGQTVTTHGNLVRNGRPLSWKELGVGTHENR